MDVTWPDEVPVLTARDIHKGDLHGPKETHCLIGWRHVAAPDTMKVWYEWHGLVASVCGRKSVVVFNDDHKTPKAKVAQVWNRAHALMGYTVGNPEAAWASRNRHKFRPQLEALGVWDEAATAT